MYRQGDVLIVAVSAVPATAERVYCEDSRVVLAYGEATGHAHTIVNAEVELLAEPAAGELFIRVANVNGAAVTHEEHDAIVLPPGEYRVIRQREYEPSDEMRFVSD